MTYEAAVDALDRFADSGPHVPEYRTDLTSINDVESAPDLPACFAFNEKMYGTKAYSIEFGINEKVVIARIEPHLAKTDPRFAGLLRSFLELTMANAKDVVNAAFQATRVPPSTTFSGESLAQVRAAYAVMLASDRSKATIRKMRP